MTRSTTAAMADKPGQRTFQEADGAFLAVVRQNFPVGEPPGIVDADMQTLPTDPVMSINRAGAACSHAMADAGIRPSFLVSRCNSSPRRRRW